MYLYTYILRDCLAALFEEISKGSEKTAKSQEKMQLENTTDNCIYRVYKNYKKYIYV